MKVKLWAVIFMSLAVCLTTVFVGSNANAEDAEDKKDPTTVDANVPGAGSGDAKMDRMKVDADGKPVKNADDEQEWEDAGVPDEATKIGAKTSNKYGVHKGGEVTLGLTNTSKKKATDVHVFVGPAGSDMLRIAKMSATGGNVRTEQVGLPGNGAGTGLQVPPGNEGSITDPLNEDGSNETKIDLHVVIECWNEKTKKWERCLDQDVELRVWWTTGEDRDKNIVVCMPDKLGSGDDRTSIARVHPDTNLSPLLIKAGSDPTAIYNLNDVALGETDNHRFMSGSFVISPNDGAVFAKDIEGVEILAFNEDGLDVTASEVFWFANPRVDRKGNFVFEIKRSTKDASHICFIIKGLKLAKLPKLAATGKTVTASVSGAVFGNRKFNNVWELVKVTD